MSAAARKESPLLLPLKCANCGAELEGGASSSIYICRNCRYAVYMKRPRERYPLVFLKARMKASGQKLYAPFWRVKGRFKISSLDKKQSRAYAHAAPLGDLFYPAFWSPKASYFQNLTLEYSAGGKQLEEEEGGSEPFVDGIRGPGPLGEVGRLNWLAYLDRKADITGVESSFEVESLAYVGIPFFRRKEGWTDGISGAGLPIGYLPTIENP